MPRETIYETVHPGRILQDDGSWKDEEPRDPQRRVEVSWSRDRFVQVATTKLRPGAGAKSENVASSDEPLSPTWDGQWMDLDRWQVNELIRHLRKARDQAFGRDE